MVIRQMARDLAIATQVIACPTVREPDGPPVVTQRAPEP
jgi:pantothenate synthetase